MMAWAGKGAELVFRPFARIIFSRDPRVGMLVFAALIPRPAIALAALAAVVIAQCCTWVFGLGRQAVEEGAGATTAALTVLTLAMFAPAEYFWGLLPVAAVGAVLVESCVESALGALALPAHALPFVVTSWILLIVSRSLPVAEASLGGGDLAPLLSAGVGESGPIDQAALLVFSTGALAGGIVISAVAFHSRVSLLLGGLGALAAFLLRSLVRGDLPWSSLDSIAGFNAVLTAMALGGIWFVPELSSLLLALVGAVAAAVLTYALVPICGRLELPVLALPFVVATHGILLATRRREVDRKPTSTVPADRPEEALARHLMRVRRFGETAWLPFRLPFRGEWIVSQGHDGAHTHQGLWRWGLDFEVPIPSPNQRPDRVVQRTDYPCYGLPVLAAGGGTVAQVVDGIDDNRPGESNTQDAWGNIVVIAHGPGVYSAYAHLQPKSISVKVGEYVAAGKEIGRCGSSGRSPVPHLHFQLQRSSVMGSATLPVDFGDVVRGQGDAFQLQTRGRLVEGETVRPVVRDDAVARALGWPTGVSMELADSGSGTSEVVRSEIDLLGRRSLTSSKGKLWFDAYEGGLVLLDFQGDSSSLLRQLLLALPRIPFDRAPSLEWLERLPRRAFLPGWLRWMTDLLVVIGVDWGAVNVNCRISRQTGRVLVRCEAAPWSSTAELSLSGQDHRISIISARGVQELSFGPVRTERQKASPVSAAVVAIMES